MTVANQIAEQNKDAGLCIVCANRSEGCEDTCNGCVIPEEDTEG